jgi:hypothetical protein
MLCKHILVAEAVCCPYCCCRGRPVCTSHGASSCQQAAGQAALSDHQQRSCCRYHRGCGTGRAGAVVEHTAAAAAARSAAGTVRLKCSRPWLGRSADGSLLDVQGQAQPQVQALPTLQVSCPPHFRSEQACNSPTCLDAQMWALCCYSCRIQSWICPCFDSSWHTP